MLRFLNPDIIKEFFRLFSSDRLNGQRRLIMTGTDDNNYMPHGNALILASKIPGAWLVDIKDAGHAVMNQYPAEIGKILNTFLSTTSTNN